jgi:hypothetical protein
LDNHFGVSYADSFAVRNLRHLLGCLSACISLYFFAGSLKKNSILKKTYAFSNFVLAKVWKCCNVGNVEMLASLKRFAKLEDEKF